MEVEAADRSHLSRGQRRTTPYCAGASQTTWQRRSPRFSLVTAPPGPTG